MCRPISSVSPTWTASRRSSCIRTHGSTDLEKFSSRNSAYLREYALRRLLSGERAGDQAVDTALDLAKPVLFACLMLSHGEQPMSRFALENMLLRQLPGLAFELVCLNAEAECWLAICQETVGVPHETVMEIVASQFSDLQQLVTMLSAAENEGGWSASMDYTLIAETVRKAERLRDAVRTLRQLTDAMLTHAPAAADPSDKVMAIQRFVEQYVAAHLAEPGLNANDIADQLHLSSTPT